MAAYVVRLSFLRMASKVMRYANHTELRIAKLVGRAVVEYGMIDDGDRILVAVSGGKDSLCLLRMLRALQQRAPVDFELRVAHVDTDAANCALVADFVSRQGMDLTLLKPATRKRLPSDGKSACFTCSWQRREQLFAAARKQKCRKIALAHHKDDIIQTTLLNLFFLGEISTMTPCRELFQGEMHIIRPLAYVEEALIEKYAALMRFPSLPTRCPHSGTTNRQLMKEIIERVEEECDSVRTNIFRALRRVKTGYLA